MKKIDQNFRLKKRDYIIIGSLFLAVILRVIWTVYTNHTYEDAYITFQYARRISQGSGFVYNPGEKICGTTTPLFTLLLAFWMSLFGEGSVIIGAKIISLIASVSSFIFLILTLRYLGFNTIQQTLSITFLVIWPKLWLIDTGGMETALVLFFITSSWYTYNKRKPLWTGFLLGLMLWTRVDTVLWLGLISGFELFREPKDLVKTLIAAGLTILPWIIFATAYFGSPIPYTIQAKMIAYSKFNTVPFQFHLLKLFKRLGPVGSLSFPGELSFYAACLISLIIILAICTTIKNRKERNILIIGIFCLLELFLLTITKATFTNRYVIPPLYILLFLAGMCIGHIWETVKEKSPQKYIAASLVIGLIIYIFSFGIYEAVLIKKLQTFNYQKSLQEVGEWLNENTAPDASVQLEPLGYAGYFANRRMLDVVGIITPSVVDLKRSGISNPHLYIPILDPDYLVVHCDDIIIWLEEDLSNNLNYLSDYMKLVTINPLNFDPTNIDNPITIDQILSRNSCYEIWGLQQY